VLGDEVFIGDEFGPYIIRATLDGVVKEVYATEFDGKTLTGPDTYSVYVPATAGTDYQVQRSGGYEGMALQPGTDMLWAMLEKPILLEGGETEGPFLRVIQFDPKAGEWTGESVKFALAEGATAIGDFNFIDETRALVIERDNGEGDAANACAEGATDTSDCYPNPAQVKNVVLVDMSDTDEDGYIRRIGHIDLLDIADPDGVAIEGLSPAEGSFTFPFFTIEDVARVDETHIMVANDNNLPFSGGRVPGEAAHNEFILLSVPELLGAE